MAMTIDDVKYWSIGKRNTGHVVMSANYGWVHLLCGDLGPGEWQEERPEKICAECRERLKNASLKDA